MKKRIKITIIVPEDVVETYLPSVTQAIDEGYYSGYDGDAHWEREDYDEIETDGEDEDW